ncbi:MAG TPA: VWA domain-containing protein [Thermoanaerobaculia bacterium]|jgi:VWFA-related protein|nr:VWA domain-containing protein [Thermoanaerobaculia bacterium]
MKRFAACVVAALSFTSIAFAQQTAKEAPPAMLSVVVTDSHGNHVPSLTKDDFQLSVGGKPMAVAKFSERGASGQYTGEMRRIAVLFDATTISAGARRQVVESMHAFLARTLRPGDMVAIFGGGPSLRPVTGWTSDLTEVDNALRLVAGESAPPPLADGQAAAEKRIREIATDIQQAGNSNHTFYTFDALMDAARAYAAAGYRDAEQSLSVISSAVSLFTPRTRNVLIVAGGGLPRTPGAAVFQYLETLRTNAQNGAMGAFLQRGAQASSPMGESSSYDLTPLFNTFGMRAWRRGIVFYAIVSDIGSDGGSQIDQQQSSDRLAAFTDAAGRYAGYHLLADETGGIAFVGRSAADALNRIASDLESFYTVGVHPTSPIGGKGDVSVKVKNGYAVRVTRGSAGAGTPADEMESRVIANQLMKPTGNALGISVDAVPGEMEGERRLVTVDVKIPIRKLKLVPDSGGLTGAFTVFIATGDSAGHSSNVTRQTKEVHWPADAIERAGDKELTFRVNVVLQPGRSQISVGVMDEQSHEKGFERVSV